MLLKGITGKLGVDTMTINIISETTRFLKTGVSERTFFSLMK